MMIDHLLITMQAAMFAGMGLGKTGAVLEAFIQLKAAGKTTGMLVVAPLRVSVITWFDEVAKWDRTKSLRIVSLRTKEGMQAFREGSADIYTINYESLPRVCAQLFKGCRKLPFDTIVLDELDNCKNPKSVRVRELRKHIHKIPRRWGMTGTPVSNNYLDLFAQIRVLDDGKRFGKFFGRWRDTYFINTTPFAPYPTFELSPLAEGKLEDKVSDMAIVLSSEKYLKIPPVRVVDIPVALPPHAKKIYMALEKVLIAKLEGTKEAVAVNAAVLVTKLLQVTSGAIYATDEDDPNERTVEQIHGNKIKALKGLAKTHKGESLLVFCQYVHERDRILKAFPEAELFKNDTVARWNAGKIKMLVSHPKPVGHGLNIQFGGHIAVWFSLGYSRALYDQANARLARFGQTHETIIYRLACAGLIDDAVIGNLERKDKKSRDFLNTITNIKRLRKTR